MIPIGNKKVKLEPEEKVKFTFLKLDDPKAHILYQELEFGNYMLFTEDVSSNQKVEEEEDQILAKEGESSLVWMLEFDGSCFSSSSSTGVVLILREGEPEPMVLKL